MNRFSERADLVLRDKRYLWHPYTPMQQYAESGQPLVIDRARGSRLFDLDGRSIIDGNASWWTSLLGHNHPRLVAALARQAEKFCHTALAGITHQPAIDCAEALARVAPAGLCHVFFSDNGSTAVEAAMKQALQFHHQNGAPDKTRFLALAHAFHGETMGVTGLCGVPAFGGAFSALRPWVHHLPSPSDGLEPAIQALEAVLAESASTIAALVLEPLIQGAGGMRMYEPEYLRRARMLTERYDVLLILDEVFTGYGRTGSFWACEQAGIAPDILCAAKGLSGGLLPFAATLSSERVFQGFLGGSERAFYYGHTYCGNPLGAAVALETLRVYEDERILEGARSRAALIAEKFAGFSRLAGVAQARALGMCGAVDLAPLGASQGYLDRAGWQVYEAALARGAYVRPLGNVVYITPALNIAESDLRELLQIVEDSLVVVLQARST